VNQSSLYSYASFTGTQLTGLSPDGQSQCHQQTDDISGQLTQSASGFWRSAAPKRETEVVSIRPPELRLVSLLHARRLKFKSPLLMLFISLLLLTAGVPNVGEKGRPLNEGALMASTFQFTRPTPKTTPSVRTWRQMTEAEQAEFIDERARHISALLGENPHALNHDAVQAIRKYVNEYSQRPRVSLHKAGVEGLQDTFTRASKYAPVIVHAFKERRVPVIVGLYLPMIESEYRACLESPYGAKGLFQFIPASARAYGVEAKDLCNAQKMAPAAAQYIADRVTEFGTDAKSMTLVLLSFNRSPDTVRRDLTLLRRKNPDLDRSFWSLFAHADKLDSYFRHESRNYVPKFFAAAIVGETPEIFGLPLQPLSAYGE
jgi:hypothetical protein